MWLCIILNKCIYQNLSKNDYASLKSVTSASCSKQTSVLVFHSSRVSVFVCEKHLVGLSASVPLSSLSELESWESLMEEFRGPEITHLITPLTPKKADSKRRKRKRCLFSSVGSCWTADQQWQADISMVTPRGALRYSDCCHQPGAKSSLTQLGGLSAVIQCQRVME